MTYSALSVMLQLIDDYHQRHNTITQLILELSTEPSEDEDASDKESTFTNAYTDLKTDVLELMDERKFDPNNSTMHSIISPSPAPVRSVRLPKLELPRFSGKYYDWLDFKNEFDSMIIKDSNLNDVDRFRFLKSALADGRKRVISNMEVTSKNFPKAWEALMERYDHDALIFRSHINEILPLQGVSGSNPQAYRDLFDKTQSHYRSLLSLGSVEKVAENLLICLILRKLDVNAQAKWEEYTDDEIATWDKFTKFFEKYTSTLERVDQTRQESKKNTTTNRWIQPVKRMDDCDAIPWSQQVDEDLCENSSYTTENKSENNSVAQFQNPPFVLQADTCRSQKQKHKYTNEIKNKLRQSFERIDVMKSNGNYSAEKINLLNVSYNPKKDNYNCSLKMSSEETRKPYFGDTSGGVQETHTKGNDSPDKNSLMSNESNKKKITWASIASQPAKPNKRNNITLKKKGPGMPPPPMIPGKHALNVNAWDLARNSPSTESCGYIPNCIPIIESETSPEDDLSAKWKPQNAEQHPDLSWKQPNVYYNKPIKNTKSYSSSVEIMVDRSIVPKHHEEQNQKIKQTNVSYIHNVKETFKGESSARCSGSDSSTFLKTECLQLNTPDLSEIVLKQLKDRNNYNPSELDTQNAALSRYFVIKSYSEDDIHRSIKYEIWCSTDHGNKKLDEAFKERMEEGGNVILFFSVNGSGHFCGMAQMMTSVDYKSTASVWSQDKWKGKFKVKWIYVKDVPNSQLRHIRLENNENKSVTNSRDTQEIPLSQGLQMLKILHLYKHLTSIFDDFYHYEKKQEESVSKKPSHFDNHVHSLPSSNVGHSDTKELYNEWHTGHFKERTMFHRGEHLNTPRNRRYGKHMEPKRNLDVQEKVTCYNNPDKQDNEDSKHILEKHSNPSIDNAGSKSNYKEIILNVNSFNCNDNSIVRENMHTK